MVLNNNDTAISEATRARVLASARALSYVPNRYAANLRGKQSHLIVMTDPGLDQSNPIDRFAVRLQRALEARGLRFERVRELEADTDEIVRRWTEHRPWMLLSILSRVNERMADALRAQGVRQVMIASDAEVGWASTMRVRSDVGLLAAKHIVTDLNHRDIALIRPAHDTPLEPILQQYDELEHYATEKGAKVRTYHLPLNRDDFISLVRQWRIEGSLPTAVYAHDDVYAIALLNALENQSISVPEHVTLVATQYTNLGRLITPSITTISPDLDTYAETLASEVARLHAADSDEVVSINPSVQARINIEESSDFPRISEPTFRGPNPRTDQP
ncbi:Ribose operon repressor [Gordonia paraffinivorans]|uniref:Ribose operon repressor n=2 Tax=Gordonia paraffinivorans TaxID=175628 RepID=A0ABD7UXK0_9ACTN|nr:Ribose operon repressor [Gordonia paraffinivorans]